MACRSDGIELELELEVISIFRCHLCRCYARAVGRTDGGLDG